MFWHCVNQEEPFVVVNLGRPVDMKALLDFAVNNSTYGSLESNLFGRFSGRKLDECRIVDKSTLLIHKTKVVFLQEHRNPANIPWERYNVKVVVDGTGKFNKLNREVDHPAGSIRGHFEKGAEKVCLTSPLKKEEGIKDAVTVVQGVNFEDYNPEVHRIISNASCSTNALANLVKPLVEEFGADKITNMVVLIPHAITGKQPALPRVPQTGKNDPCTYHPASGMYLSTTGSAKNLKKVIPGLEHVYFSAFSIRVSTPTVSMAGAIIAINIPANLTKNDLKDIYRSRGSEHLILCEDPVSSLNVLGTNETVFADGVSMEASPIVFFGATGVQILINGWFDNVWGYTKREFELVQKVRASI